MTLRLVGIILDSISSDPGSPENGESWHNSTENRFKIRLNGVTQTISHKGELDTHEGDSSNPHAVTLEQARTENNTVGGQINMGNNKIVSLLDPSAPQDAATQAFVIDQINQKLAGLDWQESVIDKDLVTAPGSPSTGDRYIIAGIGGGWSGGTIDDIAEWDGSAWLFDTPNEGYAARVMDENKVYIYDGSSWGLFEATLDHGSLLGLGDDDHTIYLLVNGSRAMSGDLNMGSNDITSVGLVDGVTVSAHKTRHSIGGADALALTAPVAITDSTEAPGSGPGYAAGDHQHGHGNRSGGTLHSLVDASNNGFQPQSNRNAAVDPVATDDSASGYAVGSVWINTTLDKAFVCVDATATAAVWIETTVQGGGLAAKSGRKLASAFTGAPMQTTVSFGTAFPDTNYAIQLTAEGSGNKHWSPQYNSKTSGGFTIELGSNDKTNLVEVSWTATVDGEA